jgi:hypothetical protein
MPRTMNRIPPTFAAHAAFAVLFLIAGTARGAEDDLHRELCKVAEQVKLLLDQKGQDAIAVGDFRGPAKLAASGGPAITKALGDELKKLGVAVKRRAELEINGEYRDVEDKKSKGLGVEIKAHVVDHSGAEIVAFEPRGLFNVTTIASLIGVTVELPADATDEERSKKLGDAIDKPEVHLASTRISAGAGSPYAIEVLVKADGAPRPRAASKDDDGFAFLKIKRGEIYSIKLINDSPYDAAVTLTIDGLNMFAFSENSSYRVVMVPARKSGVILGWHRTNKVSDSFQVTEYAKSAAAEKLPDSAGLGTITVSFAAAWPKGQPPPEDEASATKGGRSGDATGKGPPVDALYTEVVRDVGKLRASVSVRYTKDADPKDLPGSKP